MENVFKIASAILAGKDFFRGPTQYGFSWHSKDNTTCFVLGNGERIRLLHFEQAIGAIIAHASHQDACRYSRNTCTTWLRADRPALPVSNFFDNDRSYSRMWTPCGTLKAVLTNCPSTKADSLTLDLRPKGDA